MNNAFRKYSISLILLCISVVASANDTLTVTSDFYQIDQDKSLIVVNLSTEEINATWSDPKSTILLQHYYTFSNAVNNISTGVAYEVYDHIKTYTLYFTTLPVISINTAYTIPDDPRVYATFHMSERGGNITTSDLGIETRGAWSQTLPKKSYRIELWDDASGEDTRDIALLGMRSDDDWDLQAMYNEPLRIQSKTSNDLWMEIHEIYYKALEPAAVNGIHSEFVEVFLNGNYIGVYTLRERIDNKQLKLKSYNGSIRGELYKASLSLEPVYFSYVFPFDNDSIVWGGFEYEFPEDHTNWTNLHALVSFVVDSSDAVFYTHYTEYLQMDNMVDYYIFLNLLKANDNTGKNNFVARYKASEPYYYVPWDLDGVMGNKWDGTPDPVTEGILSNGIFDRLRNDCSEDGFMSKVKARWLELRSTLLSEASLVEKYSANENYLLNNAVYEREQMAWPDYAYDPGYTSYMSGWISSRLAYLDDIFDNACEAATPVPVMYPNPASEYFTIAIDEYSVLNEVIITNLNGVVVYKSDSEEAGRIMISALAPGMYIVTIKTNQNTRIEKLVVTANR